MSKGESDFIVKSVFSLKNASFPPFIKAGLFIYLVSDELMVQKKAPGITLYDFLNKNRHNQNVKLTYDCADIYAKVVAQQDEIGYNHGDIRAQNIMVDPLTGNFKTLIDWDVATKRIPENDDKYLYDFRVGVLLSQCENRDYRFSNAPQEPETDGKS